MTKQTVTFNFGKGVDNKSDPWQLSLGQFQSLVNSVFQKGGLLQKRNGFGIFSEAPTPDANFLTTLSSDLIAIGSTVNAYSSSLKKWVSRGQLEPCELSVLPLVRNEINQSHGDCAVLNGLVLTCYTQGSSNFYVIADAVTGQNIAGPTAIPTLVGGTISGSPRIFLVGTNFVVISKVTILGSDFLQYFSVPSMNPANVSAAQNVTGQAMSLGWDAVYSTVAGGSLVVAYNSTTGGQSIKVTALTNSQINQNQASTLIFSFTGATDIGTIISTCVDSVTPGLVFVSFYNGSTTNSYTAAVNVAFASITQQFAPQLTFPATVMANIASVAVAGTCSVFSEVVNSYSYDAAIRSDFISRVDVSSAGVVGAISQSIRSVGLASRAFVVAGIIYFLAAFQSTYQKSYFLINASASTQAAPVIVARLAYQNGAGYITQGLPQVTVTGNLAQMAYLYVFQAQALTSDANTQQTQAGGVFLQTGVNMASFILGTQEISSVEIAGSLSINGGFLGQFDGFLPVENNFFVFPDTDATTSTPTSNTNIAAWSATGGAMQAVPSGASGAGLNYFYKYVYEWTDSRGLIHRSTPSLPIPVTTTGSASTGSVVLHGPNLRLTAKVVSKVNIVIYRWSFSTQAYNQVTSITSPIVNDTTTDSWTYTDTLADSSVVGNNFIYTTGGVLPDANPGALDAVTVFDTRVWGISSEDKNVLLTGQQVIPNTPVEMNLQYRIYVAPTVGTVDNTGPLRCFIPMDDKLILFKENAIFYINGVGPNALGQTAVGCSLGNYSQPTFVASIVGSVNQKSLVLIPEGVMFQSNKGIWLLTRSLATTYIGAPVEDFNGSTVTSAKIIPQTNEARFTLDTGEQLSYDYYYKQWSIFKGAPATSSCVVGDLHTLLTPTGLILQETPGKYLDNQNPVLMSFTTGWLNFASILGYQRIYDFFPLARLISSCAFNYRMAYDYNDSALQQDLVTPSNQPIGEDPSSFGVPVPFGSSGDVWRPRIHAKRQLCQSFQLSVDEVFDPSQGTVAGAGFTMSGVACRIEIKSGTRPVPGINASGMS